MQALLGHDLQGLRDGGQVLPGGPSVILRGAWILVIESTIHGPIQIVISLEAIARHAVALLLVFVTDRETSLHFELLHIAVYVLHMLQMVRHELLRELVMVWLRWVPDHLSLLKLLLANRGISLFDHLRGLIVLLD